MKLFDIKHSGNVIIFRQLEITKAKIQLRISFCALTKIVKLLQLMVMTLLISISTFASKNESIIIFTPIYQAQNVYLSGGAAAKMQDHFELSTKNKVDPSKISTYINKTGLAFCGNSKNIDVRIWIKYDANAKVFGIIGGGIENGIEVTYHCR